MTTTDTLTDRHHAFVNLMAAGGISATQAWVQAGFSPTGANGAASRALARVSIQDAITARKAELRAAGQTLHVTPDWIITQLADIASDTNNDPSPRVSALRTLADIHGQLGGGKTELPQSARLLLEAFGELGRGISAGKHLPTGKQSEAVEVEARELPGPGEA